jgi:hypothetical protein
VELSDEKKLLTIEEFAIKVRADLEAYLKDWSGDGANDYTSRSHTFSEWMSHKMRYESF